MRPGGYTRGDFTAKKTGFPRYTVFRMSDGRPIATANDWGAACALVDEAYGKPIPPKESDDEYAARLAGIPNTVTARTAELPPIRAMHTTDEDPF